jgi:uncharacterized protein with ParB-like and HNH nuclease domain
MNSGFEKPISIHDAINQIDRRSYLLPALQRQFVWNTEQIEVLFDSIMRGYPINSFMFWEVTDASIKNNLKFYEFLKKYRQKYNELNPEFVTKGSTDFYAVIDGQQRLTSIYIGLKGSYAYKESKKWWRDDEDCLPTRTLYVELTSELPEDNELKMKYNFQFLSELDVNQKKQKNENWFKVGDILMIPDRNALDNFIEENGYFDHKFTKETLRQLWSVIHEKPLINFYLERNQDLAIVLDIFIRTNSGGEPLSFSDLLMSIITANWTKLDARKEISELRNQIFALRGREFQVNKDFILKTCLVLLNDNIKFQIRNFDQANIINFEDNWPQIKKAIISGFELVASFGLSNFSLRAKNAVIPLIYYIYVNSLTEEINHPLKMIEDKKRMQKWLVISLLKGVFGGQSDAVLTRIKKVMSSQNQVNSAVVPATKLAPQQFPLEQIILEFASDPSKNLSFDDAYIDELLKTQYESSEAYLILSLLYPDLDYFNQNTHKDHLHPAVFFKKLKVDTLPISEETLHYFKDNVYWNSILNLQMLNGSMNTSKNDASLMNWVEHQNIDLNTQLIPEKVSLDIINFPSFIEARKELLKAKIKNLV